MRKTTRTARRTRRAERNAARWAAVLAVATSMVALFTTTSEAENVSLRSIPPGFTDAIIACADAPKGKGRQMCHSLALRPKVPGKNLGIKIVRGCFEEATLEHPARGREWDVYVRTCFENDLMDVHNVIWK